VDEGERSAREGCRQIMTDRELLARYVQSGSEAAFAEIVDKHAAKVYSACRRILGEEHAAEDAVQAAFLLLARNARKLGDRVELSGWLFLTARNCARHMRRAAARRARHEREAKEMRDRTEQSASWEQLAPHVDDLLAALPGAQRSALVLRYLDGLSRAEAAREMGCPERTLDSRVSAGLARLRTGMRGRGVSVSAAALAGCLSERMVGTPPAGLVESVQAACLGKAAASAGALSTATGVAKAIALAKVKVAGAVLAGVVLAGSGGALTARLAAGGAGPGGARDPQGAAELWRVLAPHFQPPAEYAGDFGPHRPVLRFYDGTPVRTAADWKRRRAEIRGKWDAMMGPWPPLIEEPEVEHLSAERGENFTRHELRVKLAPQWTPWHCYLLVPDGKGPFPAVVTVYYYPEVAVGLVPPRKPQLKSDTADYALRLARRGFVALSLGWHPEKDGPHCYPDYGKPQLQALSFFAYVAANAYNLLAGREDVDPRRVGIVGHGFGGKWALFGASLCEDYACGAWSEAGVTIFNPTEHDANYQERGYLGQERVGAGGRSAYDMIREGGHDLHELQALMAPRPFLVSGGRCDGPVRWQALNHIIAVNRLLGYENRVAMTNRREVQQDEESLNVLYVFLEYFLKHGKALEAPAGAGR
jgi:RNA polymerase sigma factor (sigma-70 family)